MSDQCTALPRSHSGVQPTRFWGWILRTLQVQKSRHRLSELEPHLLADIGLTPAQARNEANRAPWDAPQIWRKPN